MTSRYDALAKLQNYASKVNEQDYAEEIRPDEEEAYANHLQRSLQSLQSQVKEAEIRLGQLRATTPLVPIEKPHEDIASRMHQLRTIAAAYKAIASADPLLPSPDSPLPALLALRSALRVIDETKSTIREYKEQISDAQSRLARENSNLEGARQMTNALRFRADKLRLEKADMVRSGADGIIATILQARQQKQMRFEQEITLLVGAFNRFVNEHLATLIAAEQLGGPVVGDDLSIDDEVLKLGFNKLGKPKKAKAAKKNANGGGVATDEIDLFGTIPAAESKAAGAGFRKLTEELLNALADEENPDSYITISEESAAVRFLIRAKVAQFDIKDARRLRLLQFGAKFEGVT